MKIAQQSPFDIRGFVQVYKNDELAWAGPNTVVQTGKNWIASRIATSPSPPVVDMSYMAIGAGIATPSSADTTLGTELARVAIPASTANLNQAIFTGTFDAGIGTGAVTEAGIFDAATDGTLLARFVFPVVNKDAADYITVYWSIQVL